MASSVTVSVKFRSQVEVLLTDLYNTKPHYIKCIKSNNNKSPKEFDMKLVLEQLRYSGALEVVRIRREGYPVNFSFRDFYFEYELLTDRLKNISDENIKRTAVKIAGKFLSSEEYQVGYERIFLRSSYEDTMAKAMSDMFSKTAILIQCQVRVKLAKNLKSRVQASFFFIQRVLRGHRDRKRVLKLRKIYNKAQTVITAISRCFLYKQRYKLSLLRVVRIQAHIRGFIARLAALRKRKLLCVNLQLLVSKLYRGMLARRAASGQKTALVKIQALGRRGLAVRRYNGQKYAVIILQSWIRYHYHYYHYIIRYYYHHYHHYYYYHYHHYYQDVYNQGKVYYYEKLNFRRYYH
jgi:myosin heavy subunit